LKNESPEKVLKGIEGMKNIT